MKLSNDFDFNIIFKNDIARIKKIHIESLNVKLTGLVLHEVCEALIIIAYFSIGLIHSVSGSDMMFQIFLFLAKSWICQEKQEQVLFWKRFVLPTTSCT